MKKGYTPQDYFDLINMTVRDMLIAGKTERSDEGDRAIVHFAFYLREGLGLPQPHHGAGENWVLT